MVDLSKATPRPWRVFNSQNGNVYLGVGDQEAGGILDGGFGLWRDGSERDANAALIVRAVNCHDELVAALESAIEELNSMCEEIDGEGFNNLEWNALLKRSKGETP